jgi:acetyl esterase/lipase
MKVMNELQYRPGEERGVLDLVLPDKGGPFPLVIVIHGGGWAGGEKGGMRPFGTWLAEIGIATILPHYRLSGTDSHPAQQDDIFAALDWAVDHSVEYGLDVSRVGMTGASAGAHLLVQAALKAPARSDRYTVRCMLPMNGVYDVALWAEDMPQFAEFAEAFLGGPVAERRDVAFDASPINFVGPDAPPCLAVHGEDDDTVPVGQSLLLTDALKKHGVDAETVVLPGIKHTCWQPGAEPLEPLGGLVRFQAFFTKHLLDA